tara:strand:- start:198 stop:929 length:732 start_codon:yes stop_codon:yes gene_type:complete
MNARGMPDVSLSEQTIERLEAEAKEEEPKSNLEIFVKPINEEPTEPGIDKVKVKEEAPPVATAPVAERPTEVPVEKKKTPKPKRKLTEKQLEALRRGREKSIETRRKKKEEKELKKAEKTIEQKAPERLAPPPQAPQQTAWAPPQIDYDKIINGVTSRLENQSVKRQEREHIVAENVNLFEQKIRDDERNKVINEIDTLQKEEDQKRKAVLAHNYLSKPKPVQDNNPYAYALQMGANSRYRRY